MKLAIHSRTNSFSERWIPYCNRLNIDYIIVDCTANDIIPRLISEGVTHLIWHLNHSSHWDVEYGSLILDAADAIGINTYPNYQNRWHFDNKVAQKYLFEALSVPCPETYVFYDKRKSIEFLKSAHFPLVAKLKRGAGSVNVKLLNDFHSAAKYANQLFDNGVLSTDKALSGINRKYKVASKIKDPKKLVKKIFQYFRKNSIERRYSHKEIGYVYFQQYIPNNEFDTRVIVIGSRAFAIRRFNRKGDFRASGSGLIDYDPASVDIRVIEMAFSLTRKMSAQCLAFDFVFDMDTPKVIEVCYGFSMQAYDICPGYWTDNLVFNEEQFVPQEFMLEDFLRHA